MRKIFCRTLIGLSLCWGPTGTFAATGGVFPSPFDRALFCAVAVPTVSPTIGRSWSARELGARFRGATDSVYAQGHKRGLNDTQIRQALDRESTRQAGMVAAGQKSGIEKLYKTCA